MKRKIQKQGEARRIAEREKMVAFAKEIARQIMKKYSNHRDADDVLRIALDIIDVELFPTRTF